LNDSTNVLALVLVAARPTASQEPGKGQATLASALILTPGLGLASTDQLCPLKPSTRVWVGNPWEDDVELPTAVHEVVVRQDTPLSALPVVPGLGLASIDQVWPSKASTSVRVLELPLELPTATQKLTPAHETPERTLFDPGLGLGVTLHVVPFNDSTSV